MLQHMIPTAFFATLLRRYLDSLQESPEYVVEGLASNLPYLGSTASAAVCIGIAAYGISRFAQKNVLETTQLPPETDENQNVTFYEENIRNPSILKKKGTKGGIRKRYRKHKQWFLKNIEHYKHRYGRPIGKIMNKLLGYQFFNETPTNLDETSDRNFIDYHDTSDDETEDNMTANNDNNDSETQKDKNVTENYYDDDIIITELIPKSHEVKNDDVTVADDGGKRKSSDSYCSSDELKNLLRENFERQKDEKERRRSRSHGSERKRRSSSNRRNSKCRRSSSNNSRRSRNRSRNQNSNNSSSKSRRNKRKNQSEVRRCSSKKTRSGRCYE